MWETAEGAPQGVGCAFFFSFSLNATVKGRVPVSSKATQERDGAPENSGIPSYATLGKAPGGDGDGDGDRGGWAAFEKKNHLRV